MPALDLTETKEKYAGTLFAGFDTIYCVDCAGVTLLSAVMFARKNQKQFVGFNGENVSILSDGELKAVKKEFELYGIDVSCECGKVTA